MLSSGLLTTVGLSDLFTRKQRQTLPPGWTPNGWFAVEYIPLERLAVAALSIGRELPSLTFDSVEALRGLIEQVRDLAGGFQPSDIRRRWFDDIATLLPQRANHEALANSNLKIELPTLQDSPDLLREKALLIRQQARKDASDPFVREHLLKLASDAEHRALGIEQEAITLPEINLTDYEKRNFERLAGGGIKLTGSLPMSTGERPDSEEPHQRYSAGLQLEDVRNLIEESQSAIIDTFRNELGQRTPESPDASPETQHGPIPRVVVGQITPPVAGYLNLIVNIARCEITRQGDEYVHLAPIKLAGDVEWPLFLALYGKAGGELTEAELRKLPGEHGKPKREAKRRLNEKLMPLDVSIPHGKWRLIDANAPHRNVAEMSQAP